MFTIRKVFWSVFVICFAMACSSSSDDNPGGGNNGDGFNRAALLINIADNIIIPAFQDLDAKLETLKSSKTKFIDTPNQINLDAVRADWLAAYKVWQFVEMFNIGKAEAIIYAFQMNVYPTSIADIEANVTSGSYDLEHPNNNDAVGFPALDYMLYGLDSDDAAILSKYADVKYTTYLSDLVDQMKSLTSIVLADWNTSYRDTFVNSTENTATSALNKLTNDYVFYFEKGLRANKIGIPAGNFSATPLPEKVEGFYSKVYSKTFALEAFNAADKLFKGEAYSSNAKGESFKTYLEFLKREDLVSTLNTRFTEANSKLQILNDSFYNQVNSDNAKMTEAYDALQKIVVLLKVDMLQAFNISVDYVDADGD
ncbi:imelysin family protein [uncultured Algibacter sp.]|uniref:imelysin family protein n=1 Tax=uncultured Algibacter sp. TaxID=298659 RepID=UPI002617E390|nr:imelysin family protein [uncultured Algibacter sp.]